jgi:hypothetical protein
MPSLKPHDNVGRVIQLLGLLSVVGIGGFLLTSGLREPPAPHAPSESAELIGLLVVMLVFSIFIIYVGRALRQHKEWARMVGMLYAVLILLAFPVGTIIGVYILWKLGLKWKESSPPP